MSATESPKLVKKSRIKKVVGLIAIALVVVFTILAILDVLSFLEWILAEIIVAVIANVIFRMVDKKSRQ
ncbi:MAG TPA: hypothetical protein VMT26_06150 [Candidatus Bathyarchaeia archaeon]|nr:hypothetical protein [Candidatus Bathyarchaeia archaeon]